MSWYSKLIDGVATVATTVAKATRAVGNVLGAGLSALASVGTRVVDTVKAGWDYVKPAVEKVHDVVVDAAKTLAAASSKVVEVAKQFLHDVRTKVRTNLGDHREEQKVERDTENSRRQAEQRAAAVELAKAKSDEATARQAKAEADTKRSVEEAEAHRLAMEDEALRVRFIEVTRQLGERLKLLLSQAQITDFGAYLKTKTCADLVVALSQDANHLDTFRQMAEDGIASPVTSIQALADGEELMPEEWKVLEELCQQRFQNSLIERSGEQLFVMWTGERFNLEKTLNDLSAKVSDAKVDVAMIEQKQKAGMTVDDIDRARAVAARSRQNKLEEEQKTTWLRLNDLTLLSGVAEGLLSVLVGEEIDDIAIEDVTEASTVVVAWSQGKELSPTDRQWLQDVAFLYRARATLRAEKVRNEVYVTA